MVLSDDFGIIAFHSSFHKKKITINSKSPPGNHFITITNNYRKSHNCCIKAKKIKYIINCLKQVLMPFLSSVLE